MNDLYISLSPLTALSSNHPIKACNTSKLVLPLSPLRHPKPSGLEVLNFWIETKNEAGTYAWLVRGSVLVNGNASS
jgi:hypothetical protein